LLKNTWGIFPCNFNHFYFFSHIPFHLAYLQFCYLKIV
jgi:hypothetical protein